MEVNKRLLFLADGRSPTALSWMQYFVDREYEVHLVSTFPCAPPLRLASLSIIPVAFSGVKTRLEAGIARPSSNQVKDSILRKIVPVGLRTALRQWLGLVTLPRAARAFKNLVDSLRPGLIHAMRIPFEGMLAAAASLEAPLLISVWGNDFTLHAKSTPWMGRGTRRTLKAADALHTDCQRDARLARAWGFPTERPLIVQPGGGGVRTDLFYASETPASDPVVVNPRGIRAYVRNDTFFKAIPDVIHHIPETRIYCMGMAEERQVQTWLDRYHLREVVNLLPQLSRDQMAGIFRRAQVSVSPSTHDGTPNTLLEAMACGCFPVVGDLESIREWIDPGVNGLLVDPADAQALAGGIILALQNPALREEARRINTRLIAERAEYGRVMAQVEQFYQGLIR